MTMHITTRDSLLFAQGREDDIFDVDYIVCHLKECDSCQNRFLIYKAKEFRLPAENKIKVDSNNLIGSVCYSKKPNPCGPSFVIVKEFKSLGMDVVNIIPISTSNLYNQEVALTNRDGVYCGGHVCLWGEMTVLKDDLSKPERMLNPETMKLIQRVKYAIRNIESIGPNHFEEDDYRYFGGLGLMENQWHFNFILDKDTRHLSGRLIMASDEAIERLADEIPD